MNHTEIRYSSAAEIELIDAAAESIASRLAELGLVPVNRSGAADNLDAAINFSDTVSVTVGCDRAYISVCAGHGDDFCVAHGTLRHHDDVAALAADLRAVL